MIWSDHSKDIPKGKHALFGGSNYAWSNIDDSNEADLEEKLRSRYYNSFAKEVGTLIHEWSADRINYRAKVVKSDSRSLLIDLQNNYIPRHIACYYVNECFGTVLKYVNDAIGFRLDAEVNLKYADDFYGTADAILYKKGEFLRVHDLKTGKTPASLRQLEIYTAFCCLEYHIDPKDLFIELRIYQNDDILVGNPTDEIIRPLMEKITRSNKIIEKIKKDG